MLSNKSQSYNPRKLQIGTIKQAYQPNEVFRIELVFCPIYRLDNEMQTNVGLTLTFKLVYSEQEYIDKMILFTPIRFKNTLCSNES